MTIHSDNDFTRRILRSAVAQVCQAIGWNSIHNTPLNILVDVLHNYIIKIGRTSQDYAALCGRTDANVLDVASTFTQLGVDLSDLEEYVQHLEIPTVREVSAYPTETLDQLSFLKPGSREVLQRPIHIYDYLPPMYPELEEQPASPLPNGEDEAKKALLSTPGGQRNTKLNSSGSADNSKPSDDNCPLREISSVIMSSTGFLSPCREGKLADSRTPHQAPDPEEKKLSVVRSLVEEGKPSGSENIMESVVIKQEVQDQDIEQLIPVQTVKEEPRLPKWTSQDIADVITAVVDHGVRESEKNLPPLPDKTQLQMQRNAAAQQARMRAKQQLALQAKANPQATPTTQQKMQEAEAGRFKRVPEPAGSQLEAAKRKNAGAKLVVRDLVGPQTGKPDPKVAGANNSGSSATTAAAADNKRQRKTNKRLGPPHSAIQDVPLMGAKPPKMPRIPKITDKDIKLPTMPAPGTGGIGGFGGIPAFNSSLIPGGNPLLPGSLYGFEGLPAAAAHLFPGLAVPGFIPGSGTPDSDIAANDSELEEGEVSPPRSEMPPDINIGGISTAPDIVDVSKFKVKKEIEDSDDEREKMRKKEAEEREKERAREAERAKEKEKEREREREREQEKEREREKEKEKEKERLKELEKEREKEKEKEKEKEREKEKEKTKDKEKSKEKKDKKEEKEKKKLKKEKKEKKEKDKDKDKEKKKEKKEKKKEKKEKKEKDKDKEKDKEKKIKSGGARVFNPEDGGVPKITIKPFTPQAATPEPAATPKLVIKNLVKEAEPPATPTSSKSTPGPGRGRPPKTADKGGAASSSASAAAKDSKSGKRSKRPPGSSFSEGSSRQKKTGREAKHDARKNKTRESLDDSDEPGSGIITETVGSYTDEAGNMVWICPACGKQDDGSPMIGCDQCDDWYHWMCVGINREPQENQDWFCTRCIAKKGGIYLDRKGGKKK